ncbi:thiamine/molybdopterin biosynthesis ThiF/MoeB-like protein [compost metagenome]
MHCGDACTDSATVRSATEQSRELEVGSSVLCGRDTVQVTLGRPLDLKLLEQQLSDRGCALTVNRYLIKAQLPEGETLVLFPDGRVLVQGTSDTERAVGLCRDRLLAAAAGQ